MATTEQDLSRPQLSAAKRVSGRLKMLLIRYRVGRWATAVVAGVLAAAAVGSALADAESARADWGTSVDVVLARRAMGAGELVTGATVELISVPTRLVPADAVTEVPVGRRITTEVGPGEILVERRLTSRSGSAASIALPPGTRGVQLDRSDVVGQVGDVVDLHALLSGSYLAEGVVVHGDEATVTVAVPTTDVAAVIDAISQGGLISVLVP